MNTNVISKKFTVNVFRVGVNRVRENVMSDIQSEMKKREVLRLSNKESNRITKECIESALLLLMAEKDYQEITISEIVKRAGVSRTAYYRNYRSKEDILNTALTELIENIIRAMTKFSYVTEQALYWKTLFATTKIHAVSFGVLLRAGFGPVVLEEITKQMTSEIDAEDIKNRYDMIFWSGAVYNILISWILGGMKQTEDEMVEICLYISDSFSSS